MFLRERCLGWKHLNQVVVEVRSGAAWLKSFQGTEIDLGYAEWPR